MGCMQVIDFLFRRTKASTKSNEIFQREHDAGELVA